MAGETGTDFAFARIGALAQERIERHQDAGRTEAALQGEVLAEGVLQRREAIGGRRQAFDSANVRALGLYGECQTGARRHAVDLHRAGAAYAVLATDMRAGCPQRMPEEIAQEHARLREPGDGAPVQSKTHRVQRAASQARHAAASCKVASPRRRTNSRR